MGYYYEDNDDEFNKSSRIFSGPVAVTITVVSGIILVILLIVLASNNTTSGRNNLKNTQMLAKQTTEPYNSTAVDIAKNYTDQYGNKDIDQLYKDHMLRSEDLDFWDMYDNNRSSIIVTEPSETPNPDDDELSESNTEDDEDDENSEDDELDDADGLIEGVKENNIDFTNLKSINGKMQYSINGNVVSKIGVDISSDNGLVDFKSLKDNEIDFVMIKVGQRGYDTGLIKMDPNFETNVKEAIDAGLEVGLYFSSRAVTVKEATEEAEFVASNVRQYDIRYPVAFLYEGETFTDARTDILERDDRTQMAEAFLNEVKSSGFTPIIYGSGEYILKDIVPNDLLKNYDVLLNDDSSIPGYPYQYKMWKYKNNVVIPGMERSGSFIISFVDYANR